MSLPWASADAAMPYCYQGHNQDQQLSGHFSNATRLSNSAAGLERSVSYCR
ncbi:hypothetical protein [Citrobacter freundii]|uniref:Uncharacterized protein n=1 Tax=Citrobacter freundii TaxID=546 RepID=A0A7G2J0E9_CITFR|nr:hypothetical protein [Citrobacter freundii]